MNKCGIFSIASAVILVGAAVLATNESGGIQFLRERVCLRVSARKLKESWEVQDLRRRAIQGEAQAQFELGCLYDEGKGVWEDHAKKSELWHSAAEQGHVGAQCALGRLCHVPPADDAEAAKWFCRAAWRGSVDAQYEIAWLYAEGKGVPKDEREAYIWLSISAMEGHSGAWGQREGFAKELSPTERAGAQAEAERRRAEIRRRQNSSAD